MPSLGTTEINGVKRRVMFCSRDKECEFWHKRVDVVREHEKRAHPQEGDGKDKTIQQKPQLRRK